MHWPSSPRHRPTHPHPHRPGKRIKVAPAGPIGPPGVGQRGTGRRHSRWQSLTLRFCTFSFHRLHVLFGLFVRSLFIVRTLSPYGSYRLFLGSVRLGAIVCTDLFDDLHGPFCRFVRTFSTALPFLPPASDRLLLILGGTSPQPRGSFFPLSNSFPQWLSGLYHKMNHGLKPAFQPVVHTFRSFDS